MAPLVIPPGFVSARFRYSLLGDPEEMITTLGFDLGTQGPDVTTANLLADSWKTNFCVSGAGLGDAWTFLGVDLLVGNDPPPGVVVRSTSVALDGTLTADTLPQNCCLLGQKRTATPGRRGRGRMFVPAAHVGEGGVNNAGVIDSGAVSALNTRMDDFLEDVTVTSADLVPVLFHSETPTLPTPLTQLSFDQRIATQRQRLRR